jgi:hypothetical protein
MIRVVMTMASDDTLPRRRRRRRGLSLEADAKAEHKRLLRNSKQNRYRRCQAAGINTAPVKYNHKIVDLLVRVLHRLPSSDLHSSAEVGAAISELLEEIAQERPTAAHRCPRCGHIIW